MLKLSKGDSQTYAEAEDAIFYKKGHKEQFLAVKTKFLNIKILPNKTLDQFADCFYYQAQILISFNALNDYDAKIAIINAIKAYKDIYITMLPALVKNFTISYKVVFLQGCSQTFRPSNKKLSSASS